jgi:hypothetical protein
MMDHLQGKAQIFVERKLAVDRDFNPCPWNAWERKYLNGKDDLTIVCDDLAVTLDHKSGKVKQDTQQLEILALLTFSHHPRVQEVRSGLAFYQADTLVPYYAMRSTFRPDNLFAEFRRYEAVLAADAFKPTSNGLCKKFCDVVRCPHNGRSMA